LHPVHVGTDAARTKNFITVVMQIQCGTSNWILRSYKDMIAACYVQIFVYRSNQH